MRCEYPFTSSIGEDRENLPVPIITKLPIFSGWAVVHVFGRTLLAGHVEETEIGGTRFLKIRIPRMNELPEFQVLVSLPSVFRIEEGPEEAIRLSAQRLKFRPQWYTHIEEVRFEKSRLV